MLFFLTSGGIWLVQEQALHAEQVALQARQNNMQEYERYTSWQKQEQALTKRQQALQQLQKRKTDPTLFLTALARNLPASCWLTKIESQGSGKYLVQGQAKSPLGLELLQKQLARVKTFAKWELSESKQAEAGNGILFTLKIALK